MPPCMQVADFQTVVFRQKQLGFNAIRLPMTFSHLNLAPKIWTKPCTDNTADLKVCIDAFVSGLQQAMCGVICESCLYMTPVREGSWVRISFA